MAFMATNVLRLELAPAGIGAPGALYDYSISEENGGGSSVNSPVSKSIQVDGRQQHGGDPLVAVNGRTTSAPWRGGFKFSDTVRLVLIEPLHATEPIIPAAGTQASREDSSESA